MTTNKELKKLKKEIPVWNIFIFSNMVCFVTLVGYLYHPLLGLAVNIGGNGLLTTYMVKEWENDKLKSHK